MLINALRALAMVTLQCSEAQLGKPKTPKKAKPNEKTERTSESFTLAQIASGNVQVYSVLTDGTDPSIAKGYRLAICQQLALLLAFP